MKYVAIIHSSLSERWRTPPIYLDAVREVLVEIDLDPASCHQAQATVKARRYMTSSDDGLKQSWFGRVYVNPPYGKNGSQSNQAIWSLKMIQEYEAGNVTEGILLVNAQTSEKWFQRLWNYPICFTNHRIKFINPEGKKSQPTHGNAFVYFGKNPERFREVFSRFGTIVTPTQTSLNQ